MSKILYLIRHGLSEGNKKGIIQGKKYDIGLSKEGSKIVKEMSEQRKYSIDNIRCSPLKRAQETAKFFSIYHNVSIHTHPEIIEFRGGVLEGLTHKDAEEKYPKEYKIRMARGDLDGIPNAETGNELQARALFFLFSYKDKDQYQDLVISHAGFLRSIINTALFRARTTPIDVDHKKIHILQDISSGLVFERYGSGANSEIYRVKTFENIYLIKKIYGGSIKKTKIKKHIVGYLNVHQGAITPLMYFFQEGINGDKQYVVEIMQFIEGAHLQGKMIQERKDDIVNFFHHLSDNLSAYYQEYPENFSQTLEKKLQDGLGEIIVDLDGVDNIIKFLGNMKIPQNIVYYDIHNQNVLFTPQGISLVDMDSFIIGPESFQLACILVFFLLEDISIDIQGYINTWGSNVSYEEMALLIQARCLIGIIFFCKKQKRKPEETDAIYLNRYIEIYTKFICDNSI